MVSTIRDNRGKGIYYHYFAIAYELTQMVDKPNRISMGMDARSASHLLFPLDHSRINVKINTKPNVRFIRTIYR